MVTRRPRTTDRNVKFADGRTMRLSKGEYDAIQLFIEANGRQGYVFPPTSSKGPRAGVYMTTRLVEIGILAWVRPGTLRWCPGVLELTDPKVDQAPAFAEPIGAVCRVTDEVVSEPSSAASTSLYWSELWTRVNGTEAAS